MTAATPLWTAAEAAAATGGRNAGDWTCAGVSIDSRTVAAGDLFIALAGPSFDGHDFVAQALDKGAAAAMVHRVPEGVDTARLLVVDDTLAALRALGVAARERLAGTVIAVTGSVGKTGTKEMLRLACGALGPTVASEGSFNNHWGLPLSLARTPRDTAWCVLEMGMNHAGELRDLTAVARPHVAIITTVEAVHLEFFASVADIARAKAEILEGVVEGGTAVLPRDNPHFAILEEAARSRSLRIVTFGEHAEAAARLTAVTPGDGVTDAVADTPAGPLAWTVGAVGRHWAMNSLAALVAIEAAGGDARQAALALAALEPPKGRGRRQMISLPKSHGGGLLTIIDESYNASPVSVRAALGVLRTATVGHGGRRVAVLGDMRELGAQADALHAGLADAAAAGGIDVVHTCGPHMARLHDALPPALRGFHAADSATLAPLVAADVRPGDTVMIKGSLGSRMKVVLEALTALAPPDDGH